VPVSGEANAERLLNADFAGAIARLVAAEASRVLATAKETAVERSKHIKLLQKIVETRRVS
jgi:hypothetical protein